MLCRIMRTGKTTVLRHLLQNKADLRIGCIVNDVASINVDAKLLRNDRNRGRSQQPKSTADLTDTIELANGCACEQCQIPAVRRCLAPVCADLLQM
jgi:G3E family GTPase